MRYFRLVPAMDASPAGMVRYLEECAFSSWSELSIELVSAELEHRPVDRWPGLIARLEGAGFSGYQDAMAGRWFSDAAQAVLGPAFDESAVHVQWLPASLLSEDRSERRDYWMLHFPSSIDVADRRLSTSGPGGFIKIVLDAAKVGDRRAFPSPEDADKGFFVAEPVMEDLLAVGVPLACFFAAPTNE